MLTRETVEAYEASRDPRTHRGVLCHAPFLSLNFEQSGRVTSCCYNREFVLGSYPAQHLGEIWAGPAARTLREAFLKGAEAPGCDLCFHQLKSGNFSGTLMRNFDRFSGADGYAPELAAALPRVLEFEISNTCNLECVMCSGNWSSTIRARQEKLPPLRSPYDRAFVQQLDEFLPSIVAAKFLGGEPFLIERYYEIWERIQRQNPEVRLTITTNATVVPQRARALLEGLRPDIVVSLDGVTAPTYEAIRKNASFERVMENLEYFRDLTRRRGTMVTIAFCPMTHNWRELPRLIEFCQQRRVGFYLNTVLRPVESSLAGLPPEELAEVIAYLDQHRPGASEHATAWDGLTSQLRGWQEAKLEFSSGCLELERRVAGLSAGDELPAGAYRAIRPVVLAYRLEHERRMSSHGDLRNLLPVPPLAAWGEGPAATALEILTALHLLCRLVDADAQRGAPAERSAILRERQQLGRYLDWLASQGGERAHAFDELAEWMRERLRQGEGDALVEWTRVLLGSLDGQALDFAHEMSRRLPDGLELLRSRGVDEPGCARVSEYFECLVHGQITKGRGLGQGDARGPVRRSPPLRGFDDLCRLMDAIDLFHRFTRPAQDPEGFRRRLDSCLDQLRRANRIADACQRLEMSDLNAAHWYLENASEDWLTRAIEAMPGPAR